MGKRIIEILLIFFSLVVIIWVIFLIVDFKKIIDRDNQRIAMVKKVQDSLENFYQANNHYPGTPYIDENNLVIYADWHYLITCPELKDYFNFDGFRDPCEPQKAVDITGVADCPTKEISYQYVGVDCEIGCKGYKLIVYLENGGKQEFISESIYKKTND